MLYDDDDLCVAVNKTSDLSSSIEKVLVDERKVITMSGEESEREEV
jgi:hypothetical protein